MNSLPLNPKFPATLLSRIEDAGLNASAPPQQLLVDGWLVRFSAGKAKRARCVNAVGIGYGDIETRLTACERIFAAAALPMIFRVTPFTCPPDLDAILEARGMQRFDDTRVMVLDDLAPITKLNRSSDAMLRPVGLEAFAQRVGGFRGSPLAHRQAHAERLLNSPVPFTAYELCVEGTVVACGQFATEGDVVGLYDIFTEPMSRGRGYAGALCRHLLREARERGAKHAYLQVEGDNHPARAVYHRIGFVDGYKYHYRTLDPSAA